ncbi:MAG: restriction endonuclease subunit S [Burkholderiaceae bacterium]|nr:restriction endonuclease subunit S [Burkholderiaceae bacterium]
MNAVLEAREHSARYLAAVEPQLARQFDVLAGAPGGVARLRELILTLAIQGKLVPQDADDEPAAAILDRVKAEKERLVREGKARGAKALPPIEAEDKPYELPPGWQWVRLGELLSKIGAGSTPLGGKDVYVTSGVKFLRSQNVWNDGLKLEGVAFITSSMHERMAGTVVLAGDLLFNITGASIGRCAVVPKEFDEGNVSQHVTIIRPVLTALNKYLHKVLISRHVQQTVMDVQVGVSREGLSVAKLSAFLIPLPPLAEQARIVARVDELMRLCDALEAKGRLEAEQHARLLSTLLGTLTDSTTPEELAANWQRVAKHFDLLLDRPEAVDALEQTILDLAVRGLLTRQSPSDDPAEVLLDQIMRERTGFSVRRARNAQVSQPESGDPPFDLPQHWAWARLGQLVLQVTDGTHHTPRYLSSGVAFISVKDIDGMTVSFDDCKYISQDEHRVINARCNPERGDILLCRIGTLGRPTVVDTDRPFSLFVSVGLLKLPKSVDISAYLHLTLSSPTLCAQYDKVKAGGSHTNKLNLGDIPTLLIPVPPLAEQARIVARVTELRRLCADLRQRLIAARATQSRLAEALVDGATA